MNRGRADRRCSSVVSSLLRHRRPSRSRRRHNQTRSRCLPPPCRQIAYNPTNLETLFLNQWDGTAHSETSGSARLERRTAGRI